MKTLKYILKTFKHNIRNLLIFNNRKEINTVYKQFLNLDHKVRLLQQEILYFKILDFYKDKSDICFQEELNYLRRLKQIALFPYEMKTNTCVGYKANFDQKVNLPYILHNDKKLYYPSNYSITEVENSYWSLIEEQNILNRKGNRKAPHQYETDDFKVEIDDIALDIGAAEGLFSLEIIDRVNKIYIIESNDKWILPLQKTFSNYQEKVTIINKYISDKDTDNEIKIGTILKNRTAHSVFIKMDIEGDEVKVIYGNRDFLENNLVSDLKIAACTYHRQSDAKILEELFSQLNFETEFSNGYMVYVHDPNQAPPYFRRGLIRARKKQTAF